MEEERQRIRRDLHDDLGPRLAGIRLRLLTVADQLDEYPAARQLIQEAAAEIVQLTEEMRRVVEGLPPEALDRWSLGEALRRLVVRVNGLGADVTADVPDVRLDLSATTERALYRIAEEGLTNALRHADAHHVRLRLLVEERDVILEMADDGVGLRRARKGGIGLTSMRLRAEEANGYCVVVPARPQPGTLVRAVLPRRAA
ncbi:sensor histidine kinase [Nonomuraea typhae]|uniref:Sensor histidine kinase n=1 Tax=Nonomuraea typhae TaxID=2603600 RepID=A0ABW7Z9H1_9ACTN